MLILSISKTFKKIEKKNTLQTENQNDTRLLRSKLTVVTSPRPHTVTSLRIVEHAVQSVVLVGGRKSVALPGLSRVASLLRRVHLACRQLHRLVLLVGRVGHFCWKCLINSQ